MRAQSKGVERGINSSYEQGQLRLRFFLPIENQTQLGQPQNKNDFFQNNS